MKKLGIYFIIVIASFISLVFVIKKFNTNQNISIDSENVETNNLYEMGADDIPLEEWPDEFYEKYYNIKNITEEDKAKILDWFYNGSHDLIGLLCQKNGDWSRLPVSNNLREKYNERDGVLPNYQFDKVEVEDSEYPQSNNVRIIATKGLEKTKFYLGYSSRIDGIDNIEVLDVIRLTDEKGNELNPGFPFDDKHILTNFVDWENVGLTNKFKNKYGDNLLNLFIHYSPLDYNSISFIFDKSDLTKNMAYFTVDSVLECKKREYEVYYTLDKDKYLDDAEARLVKEVDTEPNKRNSTTKAFYKHSNLINTNLSNELINSINKNGSYNPDIDYIDINYLSDEECLDKNYLEYIRCYRMKDGSINSYHVEYVKNGEIFDNIISTKLPYTNMSAKEVKDLYLKKHNQ